jgi:predicted TIM-barrel fold metal-dependent hydrolase
MPMSNRIIVDTHAHFAVRENKSCEAARSTHNKKAARLLRDLNKLKAMVSGGGDLLNSSNFLDDYIECMKSNKISISWLHQLSFESILGYETLSNEQISKAIGKYPRLFRGFASVNPHEQDAPHKLESAIKNLGLHGFKLNPNDYGGFLLNDREKLYPLYEKCCKLEIPVSVHTGITPGTNFRMRHNYPVLLDDVAVDFPELTLIVEHMGFPWSDLCYYMVTRHDRMFVTVTAVANILIHTRPNVFKMELAKMISQCGCDKILWGSDWTVTPNIAEVLSFFRKITIPLPMRLMGLSPITQRDIDKILGENALRILN